MAKTKEDLQKEKKRLEAKIEQIDKKITKLNEPLKIGFKYPNRII